MDWDSIFSLSASQFQPESAALDLILSMSCLLEPELFRLDGGGLVRLLLLFALGSIEMELPLLPSVPICDCV